MLDIAFDTQRCRHCNICVEACPEDVFERGGEGTPPRAIRTNLCIACGHCAAVCPTQALQHSGFPPECLHLIAKDRLPNTESLLEHLRARRSARAFAKKPVPRSLLETIIEAARLAPTAHNYQATHYIVIQDNSLLDEVSRITVHFLRVTARRLRNPFIRFLYGLVNPNDAKSATRMLASFEAVSDAAREGRDKILRGAPCLLIFHADPSLAYPDKSAQLAAQNASLIAGTLGLAAFYTGYVVGACEHQPRLRALIGVPRRHRVYAGLAIGYPRFAFTHWPERAPAPIQWR